MKTSCKVYSGGAVSMMLRKLLSEVAQDPSLDAQIRLRAAQLANLIPHQGRGINKSRRWLLPAKKV